MRPCWSTAVIFVPSTEYVIAASCRAVADDVKAWPLTLSVARAWRPSASYVRLTTRPSGVVSVRVDGAVPEAAVYDVVVSRPSGPVMLVCRPPASYSKVVSRPSASVLVIGSPVTRSSTATVFVPSARVVVSVRVGAGSASSSCSVDVKPVVTELGPPVSPGGWAPSAQVSLRELGCPYSS